MSRLILHMSVSLDGFSANGNGAPEWSVPTAVDHGGVRHQANVEMLDQAGSLVIGSGAYRDMFPAWSSSDSAMGRIMNRLPKVVFSDSLDAVEWENARLNERPLEEEVLRLKEEPGGDVFFLGGAGLAHSLIAADLVDEYRLTVHPVALGRGLSLMHGLATPKSFELVSATVYADGSVLQVLRPA